jgi:ribonuclease PH
VADNVKDRGAQDRSRIAMGQEHEVAYWTKKFRVSREQLAEAIDAAGNSAQAVADFLNKRL